MAEFERIYRACFQDVNLYLRRLTGDASLAEELTSETFFKAMQALDGFRGDCDVRVWLCQIAKNCYFSYQKKQRHSVPLPETDVPAPTEGLETALLRQDEAMRIHVLLHDLAEPYKEVFMLRVFGELGFQQIGTLFGKTANWACVTYHRAKAKIAEKMEETSDGKKL